MDWNPVRKIPRATKYLEPILTANRYGKAYFSVVAEKLLADPDAVVFLSDGNGRRAVRAANPDDPANICRPLDASRSLSIGTIALPPGRYRLDGEGPVYELILTERPKRGKTVDTTGTAGG